MTGAPNSRVWVLATIDFKTNDLSLTIPVAYIFPGEKKLHSIDKRQIDFISFAIYQAFVLKISAIG